MSLGAYGDGGSMRGSGINSGDYYATFACSECDKEFDLYGQTDDWGSVAYAECPDCGRELEVEVPSKEDLEKEYWADRRPGK